MLSSPGCSGGDEPGFEVIAGLQHKRRTLNTQLSPGTSAGTSSGPYIAGRARHAPEPPRATRFQPEFDSQKYPVPLFKYCIKFVYLTLNNTQSSFSCQILYLICFQLFFKKQAKMSLKTGTDGGGVHSRF